MKNKHYKLFVCIALLLAFSPLRGQQKDTHVEALVSFSKQKWTEAREEKEAAEAYATEHNLPIRYQDDNGCYHELQSINSDGTLMYYISDNAKAARTIYTNYVQDGGRNDLSLDGHGIELRMWDAGAVRLTHQEFTGRISSGDNNITHNSHATHVAGTMIASGVNPEAKGMACQARLKSFDWCYDASEMALEAAEGALISNHSYGYCRGWVSTTNGWEWRGNPEISEEEDYLFGFYDRQARDWDQIAYHAPYYLIVKSAGNDRNEGPGTTHPKDGPYDCLSHAAVAKNVLTVGAIYPVDDPDAHNTENIRIAEFSSFGPTDDGRIKPDIVTQGVDIFSTDDDADDDYRNMSGTSTAAPSASGSLALLQQLWEDIHGQGNYLLAATLKALVIHTADEAGPADGPDYEFGWGLMNTERAAMKIEQDLLVNVIDELDLNNGDTYTRTIRSDGKTPIKVTICWTDAPGTVLSAQLDPETRMLVNDLDLKIIHNGTTYYPWHLNPALPQDMAVNDTKNYVDNVEVVDINNPEAGEYTIVISHEGTLNEEHQNFSIIISGMDGSSLPVVDFNANKTEISAGDEVVFECKSKGNPTSREWSFPGGFPSSSTEKNPVIKYDNPGTYKVLLTVRNNLGTDTKVIEDFITVKEDFSGTDTELNIKVYPNPAVSQLNLEVDHEGEPAFVQIINPYGTIYKEFNVEQQQKSVDVSSLPKGVYYAIVYKNGQSDSCKFLKY
jgi:PKD repeat protein/subtilisin family serine protease